MSYLRLYQPDVDEQTFEPDEEPRILSFEEFAATWQKKPEKRFRRDAGHADGDVLSRARIVYLNRRCPYCKHPLVEPVELTNARLNLNRHPMPGTATLVGFHCGGCCREWPA